VRAEVSLQQAKSARSRDVICRSTIKLLAEVGYAETTINRVAQRAGVSKGAVQYHFPGKEDLIAATVDMLLLRTFQKGRKPADVEASLLDMWQRFVNTTSYRALLEVLNAARTDRMLQARISAQLVAWGQRMDQQSLQNFTASSGEDADVVMLLNMTRSFMRGLLLQEQYGVSQETTLEYMSKWIELVGPLLRLRQQ